MSTSDLLYQTPFMSKKDMEAYMWQKVPGAPETKYNPFRKSNPVPYERYNDHNLLGVGNNGHSHLMSTVSRGGPAGSIEHMSPRQSSRSGMGLNTTKSNTSTASSNSYNIHQNYNKSQAHSPHTLSQSQNRNEIPIPGVKGEYPFLQAYDDLVKEDKYEEFRAPSMWNGSIIWNPRASTMHNMQDWHTERQTFLRKLQDPRRQYLARYAHIREKLCSDRFRNPEYTRIVPGTCLPKQNPWNYNSKGGVPSMFDNDALWNQTGASGPSLQRSIGTVNEKTLSDNPSTAYDVLPGGGFVVVPQTNNNMSYPSCPFNTTYDSTTGVCTSINM